MRKSMTIRMDPDLLEAAKRRARGENRTVTNYIETVLRKDLRLTPADIEVWAPPDIREFELIREAGEDDEHFDARRRLIASILDRAGY